MLGPLDSKEEKKQVRCFFDSKETEVWLFFRVEGDECDYGFFVIYQVLMNFESFIMFEKI